ncbi:MAG: hypothetical protein ACHQ4G_03010 [Opitutales bacterium]
MPQRQDYILRLIDELREFVSAMLRSGDPGKGAEALHAVLHAQQQLFQRPPAEFLSADLGQQIDLLAQGESPAGAVENVATYAALLEQAARVYDGLNRPALALGSRQLALAALAAAAARWPAQRADVAAQLGALRAAIPDEALNPPVRELLRDFDATP